jgi:NTE family protein
MSWLAAILLVAQAVTLSFGAAAASPERPRVALVLSGGGALGYAHIGVLEILEEMRVPIDCVVGTSMGALVGGAYAAGVDPARMREVIGETDIIALFDDQPPRAEVTQLVKRDDARPLFDLALGFNDGQVELPAGASAGYKFELFLKRLIGFGYASPGLSMDELPLRYRAVATDLETGEMRVFDRGELPKIMRASMSLPAIVAPTVIDDRIYIDGGLVRNLPVDIGRELCGEVVIAVNLGTPVMPREKLRNALDVARQSILILTEQNVRASLAELRDGDVLITPELGGFTSMDFNDDAEIIARGVAAADAQRKALGRLGVSAEDYAAWRRARAARVPTAPRIARIATGVDGDISESAITRDIETQPGDEFDTVSLDQDLSILFGRGDFSYVGYSVVPGDDGATLLVEATQKTWGPGYLRFGIGVATDLDSPAQFNFAGSYRRTWLNDLGAEWRVDAQLGYSSLIETELLQPLQIRDGAFLALHARYEDDKVQIYDEDTRLGDFQVEDISVGVDLGVSSKFGELRFGPYYRHTQSEPGLGALNPAFETESENQVGFELFGVFDQLDSLSVPRDGVLAAARFKLVEADLGSDEDYLQARARLAGARSFGESTLFGQLEWGDLLQGDPGDVAETDLFQLGGPRRLSGLYLDQLTGTRYNLASVSYYFRYASLPSQLGRGLFVGAGLDAGRINDPNMKDPWDWVGGASVFWGADTRLGPAYLGYGYSSLGQGTIYLTIGPYF